MIIFLTFLGLAYCWNNENLSFYLGNLIITGYFDKTPKKFIVLSCNLLLISRYGAVVFIASVRFETSKKKLAYLEFSDLFQCAMMMMGSWTSVETDQDDTDIDREFLLELRDLRVLLDKEKEHRHLVCTQVAF